MMMAEVKDISLKRECPCGPALKKRAKSPFSKLCTDVTGEENVARSYRTETEFNALLSVCHLFKLSRL